MHRRIRLVLSATGSFAIRKMLVGLVLIVAILGFIQGLLQGFRVWGLGTLQTSRGHPFYEGIRREKLQEDICFMRELGGKKLPNEGIS